MADDEPDLDWTSKDLRHHFSITANTVTDWIKAGCPHERVGKGGRGGCGFLRFSSVEVKAWAAMQGRTGEQHFRRIPQLQPGAGGDEDSLKAKLIGARLRKTEAEARLKEIAAEERLGKLLLREDVEREWARRAHFYRHGFVARLPKLAKRLHACGSEAEVLQQLTQAFNAHLEGLAGGRSRDSPQREKQAAAGRQRGYLAGDRITRRS